MSNKEYKKQKPIDIDQIDLEEMKERTTDLPGLIEYAHSLGGFSITPTNEGQIKGQALEAMKGQTDLQMKQIYEQMQLLANQASKLKRRADISIEIYQAKMSFKPVMGQIYFLYKKIDHSKVLSMVSPEEWGKTIPFEEFIAKVKLLADHTWQVLEDNSSSQ